MNPTGTKVVCLSLFLLRLSLPLMFAASFYSTRHHLCQFSVIRSRNCTLFIFFWIHDFVRKILNNFEKFSQPAESVGKSDSPVH